ncbi:ATP-binding protein [Sulfitobacter sp. TSTF-M16]|uniref:ATP-binding protein n=2 Tax=Sulfitobacter aestuariivivens TaxID=2766981 RepID=A0A927D687_9RHOB|nr:ATP-binding protein [Sulfitobacter aestuariivivens]
MLAPFDVSVISSEHAVRDALRDVIHGLGPLGLDIEEVGTVELVLAEALNNIVEHAYPPDAQGGPIHVTCRHRQKGLFFTIRDRGKAMPDGQIPLGMVQDVNVDVMDMPEGGFGWFMIRDLAKDVAYQRQGCENELQLRLAIAVRRAPP